MRNRFPVTLWLTLVALVAALASPRALTPGPFPRRQPAGGSESVSCGTG